MQMCSKCGLPLAFKRLNNGRFCPTNPDGSDHWDICRLTAFKNSGQKVKVGELEYLTVPTGKMPMAQDSRLPWDESIVEDWSWCKGWKSVAAKNAYKEYATADEVIARIQNAS